MKNMVLLLVLLSTPTSVPAADADKPIRRLAWLIGEWHFEDAQVNGDYRESGTRSCDWALNGDYIRCVSNGTNQAGKQRVYVWHFNFNHLDQRFEITGLFEGFPRKILHAVTVSEDNHRLEMVYGGWERNGIVLETHAIVKFDGESAYTWESHAPHDGPERDDHPVRFRDHVRRVSQSN